MGLIELLKALKEKNKTIKDGKSSCKNTFRDKIDAAYIRKEIRKFEEDSERVGFLDIESDGLNANFAICLTYCIADKNERKPIIERCLNFKDCYNGEQDKRLIMQFCEDVKAYDRLVVHYGGDRRFDLPFLRTRAVYWQSHGVKLDFPKPEDNKYLIDTWKILKDKYRLNSNRLATACDFFGIPSKHHPLKGEIWTNLRTGNPKKWDKSMAYIIKHNREDVIAMRSLWRYISPYANYGKVKV